MPSCLGWYVMRPQFIKNPIALFVRFGQYTGQFLSSSIYTLGTNVTIRVASFYFSDIIDLHVPHSNFQYFFLLRSLIDDKITFVNIGIQNSLKVPEEKSYSILNYLVSSTLREICAIFCFFLFLIIKFQLFNRNCVDLVINYISPTPKLLKAIRLMDYLSIAIVVKNPDFSNNWQL